MLKILRKNKQGYCVMCGRKLTDDYNTTCDKCRKKIIKELNKETERHGYK